MKVNTRTILIITMSLSTVSVIRQNISTQMAVLLISITLIWAQQARKALFCRLFGRLKHLWIAVLSIFILQILFRHGGEVYFSFSILRVTEKGLFYGITVSLRLINLIMISGLLFNIPSSEFMLAFKAWRIPYEISFLITTVIRFIPDYYRMFITYKETLYLRNIDLKRLSLKHKLNAITTVLITVLVGNLSDVKKRAIALEFKAFRLYPTRTYLYDAKLRFQDYIIQTVTVAGLVLMLIL